VHPPRARMHPPLPPRRARTDIFYRVGEGAMFNLRVNGGILYRENTGTLTTQKVVRI